MVREQPLADRREDLGVQYNLRFNRRRRSASRSATCSRASRRSGSGRCARPVRSATANRWRSSARTAPARAPCSRSWPGSCGRPRARSTSAATSRACSTLGVGFDQELIGLENILLGGAFLGLDDLAVGELLPSIVEFADLGQFIDAPLKTYSSGMRARLGFAIATSVDPDILLLDEVLATGDADSARSRRRASSSSSRRPRARARDPRHGLGRRVLQPGDAAREGPRDLEGDPAEVVRTHMEHSAERKAERAARLGSAGL